MCSSANNKGFFSFSVLIQKTTKCRNRCFVFPFSRQKACIYTKTGFDFEGYKSSLKGDATTFSCNPGNAPKPTNLFSLPLNQINTLSFHFSHLPAIWVSLFTPARYLGFTFDVSLFMSFTNDKQNHM